VDNRLRQGDQKVYITPARGIIKARTKELNDGILAAE
jgi:hypothetical protein